MSEIGDRLGQVEVLGGMAKTAACQRDYQKSIELNEKALDMASKIGCKLEMLRCHARLQLLSEVCGDGPQTKRHASVIRQLVHEMDLFCGVCGDIIGQAPERLEPLSCVYVVDVGAVVGGVVVGVVAVGGVSCSIDVGFVCGGGDVGGVVGVVSGDVGVVDVVGVVVGGVGCVVDVGVLGGGGAGVVGVVVSVGVVDVGVVVGGVVVGGAGVVGFVIDVGVVDVGVVDVGVVGVVDVGVDGVVGVFVGIVVVVGGGVRVGGGVGSGETSKKCWGGGGLTYKKRQFK
ncbi:43 kDa receptor-associated protein of the synapse [Bulinus truncatus]|nr:43 kDa receptor-associated protein of the synapse [Bulinus truncatus]